MSRKSAKHGGGHQFPPLVLTIKHNTMKIELPTENIPVKGVSIHGKDLKKLLEYYFEIFTRWDAHETKYQNVSRLQRPINSYSTEAMTIESCMRCLGLRDEYSEYFKKRRAIDPYWIERDKKNNYTPEQ